MTQKPSQFPRVVHRPNSHAAEMERLEVELRLIIQRYRQDFRLTETELRDAIERALKD